MSVSHAKIASEPLLPRGSNNPVTRSSTLPTLAAKLASPPLDLRRSYTSVGGGGGRHCRDSEQSPSSNPLQGLFQGRTPPPTPATRSSSAYQIAYHQSVHTVTLAQEVPKIAEVPDHLQNRVKETIHRVSVTGVEEALRTDFLRGLASDDARSRVAVYGPNVLPKAKVLHPALKLMLLLLFSGFSVLLWVSAALCFIAYQPLGQPPDKNNLILGGFLVVIALYQGTFTFYQEYRSEKVLESFKNIIAKQATIVRDGQEQVVDATVVTVGDVVLLKSGESVPADVRLVEVSNLSVDNSAMTGESEPVHCSVDCTQPNFLQATNMAWFGTTVVDGTARGVVTAVGAKTVLSTVVAQASMAPPPTTIELEARKIVIWFGALAILTGVSLFVIWVTYVRAKYPAFVNFSGQLTNCIGVVVAYVPEGLPVCVTISLAIVAKVLVRRYHVVVTRLGTVETLGAVSLIASDKTGTLTTNSMTVRHVVVGDQLLDYTQQTGSSTAPEQSKPDVTCKGDTPDSTRAGFQALLRAGVLCNSISTEAIIELESGASNSSSSSGSSSSIGGPRRVLNPVDKALLTFASKFQDLCAVREAYPSVAVVPFNSRNKWMATIHALASESSGEGVVEDWLLMKGAPEYMLQRCSTMLQPDGSEVELSAQYKFQLTQKVEYLGGLGERCIGLCQRKVRPPAAGGDYNVSEINFPVTELCFMGLVAVMDPPRSSVPGALRLCHKAGIKVVMVTGDHPATATAIAREVGIITTPSVEHISDFRPSRGGVGGEATGSSSINNNNSLQDVSLALTVSNPSAVVVVGSELPSFTPQHWTWVLGHGEMVFARTSPEQKLLIVEQCQKVGHTVAVTGDGVNDAPALKKADIGIAMGAGSEMAREAADMVLLQNDFAAIVQGIKQGRCLYDNLKKVLVYVLPAGEFSEILPVVFNVCLGIPLPLSAFLMILICVGTDFFADLALVYEPPDLDIMDRRPRNRKTEALFTWRLMFTGFAMVGVVESFFAFWFYFMYLAEQGIPMSQVWMVYDKWGDGYLGFTLDQLNEFQFTAQSIYFVTLIVAQYGNLLMTRGRTMPLLESVRMRGVQLPLLNRLAGRRLVWFRSTEVGAAAAAVAVTSEGGNEGIREEDQDNTQNILLAILGSVALALFVTLVPFMNSFFSTRPVAGRWWGQAFGVACLILVLGESRKYYIRKYPHSLLAWLSW